MLSRFRNYTAVFLAILVSGCSADDNCFSSGTGKISVSVVADLAVTQSTQSRETSDDYSPLDVLGTLSADSLALRLVSDDGSFTKSWDNAGDFSESEEFPTGSYTLTAYYGDLEEEGIEKPYILGETTFDIQGAKTVSVDLTATVANSIVGIEFTENFRKYFSAFCGRIVSVNGNEFLFSAHESTPVYIAPGNTGVEAEVTLPSGKSGTVYLGSFEAEAATYHRITLDVDASRGDLVVMLLFDDTLDEQVVEREISDALFDAGAPVVTPEGFEGGVAVPFVEGNYAFGEYKFNIAARRGMKELWLTLISPLYGGGYQERYNLLNEQTRNDLISEHGIEIIGVAEGEMFGKIDLSSWLEDLKRYDRNVTSEDVTFSIEVVDASGATTDIDYEADNNLEITLYGETLRVELDEESVSDDSYEVKVYTNMNWISGRLSLTQKEFDDEIAADYQVLSDSVIDPTYATENVFTLKVPMPSRLFKFEQSTVTNAGTTGENLELTGKLPEIEISYDENDIYVKSGKFQIVPVAGTDNEYLYDKIVGKYKDFVSFDARIWHSGNDGSVEYENLTESDDLNYSYTIENYPDSKYQAEQSIELTASASMSVNFNDGTDEIVKNAKSVSITTEAPLQLYNGDMETWTRVDGQTNFWWIDYLDSSGITKWSTMNEKTTHEGGTGTNAFNRSGCAYCANSGTQPTEDCHGGNYAAIIRTVGWGSSNSAAAISGFGTCNNVDAGELFLGTLDDDYNQIYGIDFPSRPTAIKFWYKYSTVTTNDDQGVAIVQVLDADNNKLFESNLRLSAISDYTQYEIPITYSENSGKASTLILTFKSSYMTSSELVNKVNSTYMTAPSARNLSDGEYIGSKLYIDEVELVY